MRSWARASAWLWLGIAFIPLAARTASAIFLDEDRNVSLRARIYSQAAVRLSDSQTATVPETDVGDLVQQRNFYNPELEAKLVKYTEWMNGVRGLGWLAPEDFTFRIAAWGFYDGIYDYGAPQFNRQQREVNRTYPDPAQYSAFFLEGNKFACKPGDRGGAFNECVPKKNVGTPGERLYTVPEYFPDADLLRPRDIYAHRQRVNELYLNYTKGPLFVRLGRQAISWGEADTIGILDQNNPFDVTRGAPGAFIDLDEARIPLWTLRTSFDLLRPFNLEAIGPFASPSIEAYWVPGFIDTETGDFPVLTASPYSPNGYDPQTLIRELQQGGLNLPVQFVLFDHVPDKRMRNSRYGFRFQTVIARDHTFSVWYYTHFPNQPVPRALGLARTNTFSNGQPVRLFTTETIHKLTSVYGIADSFFVEPIDSIIRTELEYFENEPAFIPELNLGASSTGEPSNPLKLLTTVGTVPVADFLRWELGVDRFFFLRALNPTNSFTFAMAFVGSYNLDDTGRRCTGTGAERVCVGKEFRYAGLRKQGKRGDLADDFVQLKKVEAFSQMHLETTYMHGRISPAVTVIANVRGTHAVLPEVTFRLTDWLLLGVKAVYIGGEFQQIGFYRDRDEISFRATYLLN